MRRFLAGAALLAMPAAAIAQDGQADPPEAEDDGGCCSFLFRRPPTEEIVVRGSGLLRPADSDAIQASSLIADTPTVGEVLRRTVEEAEALLAKARPS